MSELLICGTKEIDYFILEDMPDNGSGMTVAELLASGNEFYFIFSKDGSFQAKIFGKYVTGKWSGNVLTAGEGDEAMSLEYTLDGDLLKMAMGGEFIFRRSGETPPDCEADGGKTIETSFTDANGKNGVMSAVCPEGWYSHQFPMINNALLFTASVEATDENAAYVKFLCYAKLFDTYSVLREGEPLSFTVNGRTWEGVYDKAKTAVELFIITENNIADINSMGIEPDSDIFQQVLNSFNLVWE